MLVEEGMPVGHNYRARMCAHECVFVSVLGR